MKKTTIKVTILLFTILLSFGLFGIKQIVKLNKIDNEANMFIIEEGRNINGLKNISIIPSKFDLRDYITIGVEEQGDLNICYAYAALTSVETYISRNFEEYTNNPKDFSEIDLAVNSAQGSAGFFDKTYFSYFKKGYGPVEESAKSIYDDSIVNSKMDSTIYKFCTDKSTVTENEYNSMKKNFENNDPEFYVYGIKHFNRISGEEKKTYTQEQIDRFRSEIKIFIMNNGSIYADTIIPIDGKNYKINSKGIAVMNTKDNTIKGTPHAVSIIGWDDDFSASNFPSELGVTKNGAYLALNSWGKDWGNNGYFWISYEDYYVETSLSGVNAVSKGKIEISDVDIDIKDEPDGANVYNRAEHKLEITCNYKGMDVLDYFDIKYSNNVNAGIAKVTITGTGAFTGTIEKEFEILPYDLESDLLNITYKHPRVITRYEKKINDYIRGIEYTGKEIKPTILINGIECEGDITVEFRNNVNIGKATAIIKGDGKNVLNRKNIEFNIIPIFIKNTNIIFGDNVLFDGTERKPDIKIKYEDKILVEGVDYKFEFDENEDLTKIGKHLYKIEGIGIYGGEYYVDSIDNPWLEFEIVPVLYKKYFTYDNCLMGIRAKTTIKEFKENIIKANIDNFVFLDKNGKKIEGEYSVLKTGMRVCYMSQDEVLSINYIVVMGDLNGDGKLTLTDVVKASLRLNKIITLDKFFEKALDLNLDKDVTLTDLVKINLANLKIIEL